MSMFTYALCLNYLSEQFACECSKISSFTPPIRNKIEMNKREISRTFLCVSSLFFYPFFFSFLFFLANFFAYDFTFRLFFLSPRTRKTQLKRTKGARVYVLFAHMYHRLNMLWVFMFTCFIWVIVNDFRNQQWEYRKSVSPLPIKMKIHSSDQFSLNGIFVSYNDHSCTYNHQTHSHTHREKFNDNGPSSASSKFHLLHADWSPEWL